MFKTIALAATGLVLLTFAAEAEAASKPRMMMTMPRVNLNSSHLPPMRILRLKLRAPIQVSGPTFRVKP